VSNDRVEGDDIEALERLSIVPDIGSSELQSEEEFLAEDMATPEKVAALFAEIEGQNAELLNRLQILGKGINPLMLLKIQVDTLLDFVFENDEARLQYETACSMRLNETLKVTIAQLLGATVDA